MADAEREVRDRFRTIEERVEREVRERPYPALGAAALAGYVLGGGLFSSLTRPLARAVMGAFLVRGFRESFMERLRDLTGAGAGTEAEATGARW
jgi:hypothetical protein